MLVDIRCGAFIHLVTSLLSRAGEETQLEINMARLQESKYQSIQCNCQHSECLQLNVDMIIDVT